MTAKKADLADLPQWPRLLSREQAAAYVGLSPNAFDAHFADLPTIRFGRAVRFDRLEVDKRVDRLAGYGADCPAPDVALKALNG